MLDDLLDVSRIERGRIELKLEPVDLRTVLKFGIEAVREQLQAKRQTLSAPLPEAAIIVDGDAV